MTLKEDLINFMVTQAETDLIQDNGETAEFGFSLAAVISAIETFFSSR